MKFSLMDQGSLINKASRIKNSQQPHKTQFAGLLAAA